MTQFAQKRGRWSTTAPGSVAPYLWALIEFAYLCRLHAIEVLTLTEANALEAGILTNRRKGSWDKVVRWNERLRHAWAARNERWKKKGRAYRWTPPAGRCSSAPAATP